MKNQICISVAKRNEGIGELLETYSNLYNLSQSDTFARILRHYDKEQTQEKQLIGYTRWT